MTRKQTNTAAIADSIYKWENSGFSRLKETEIIRTLTDLEKEPEATEKPFQNMKAKLLAMAAAARYNRTQLLDKKVAERLEEAKTIDDKNMYVAETVIYIYSKVINEQLLSDKFPVIRETDHSQGKKKAIDKSLYMAEETETKLNEWLPKISELKKAAETSGNSKLLNETRSGEEILLEAAEQMDVLKEAAAEYKASISGIYFSKEKHKAFKTAIDAVSAAAENWEAWRESQLEAVEDDALKKLHSMVGLEEVKEKINEYYHYLIYEAERKKQGYQLQNEQSLNMILTGNPGTGKTELARLLAKIYYKLGVLPREEVIEADRSQLVGAYVGQTEEKTMEVIKSAAGGVLFIDEAYSLKREGASGTDYGQAAVDTLVSAMTSGAYASRFGVILAGYPEEMRNFLWSNPGLRSRFPESNHIHLPDYSIDELIEIGERMALDNDYTLTGDALAALRRQIIKSQVDETFGNARTVKNIILDAIFKKGAAVARSREYSSENFTVLDEGAFEKEGKEKKQEKSGKEQLNELIGLKKVKDQVKMLASFVEVQKKREEEGLPSVPVQLHGIFTGPPGTGKTTVAKIYGKILSELGLLKRGHLVVAGRSDLVAGYTGQTASKTKKKIREALGGVLFIDEAYSLTFQKGAQDFGKEAIDTMVEEMTKHDENLVVILAGYSKEMEQLIDSNPGLSSRFKKMIEFPSYSPGELIDILNYYIGEFGYEIDKGTEEALEEAIEQEKPAGNARAMKNLAEEAIQRQAYRLIQSGKQENKDVLTKLEKEDFSILDKGAE
ncbi:AAA family ATPase [Evansella clarkii]|uniref:AAA family ATPase n=1 Tax=Evansella clarkii TaxID=79879 RepID=UPI000997E896|nr:AAA family ATPase [Evansella clarkii]